MKRFLILTLTFLFLTACSPTDQISIVFLGDTHWGENYQEELDENVLAAEGYDYHIANFHSFLNQATLAIANLETPLTLEEQSPLEGLKNYIHYSDPDLMG